MKTYFVYILSNPIRTVFYIGITSNLGRRLEEHRASSLGSSFTSKYNCKTLIYYEELQNVNEAITREKQLKKWNRTKKLNLIQRVNPKLRDLSTGSR